MESGCSDLGEFDKGHEFTFHNNLIGLLNNKYKALQILNYNDFCFK